MTGPKGGASTFLSQGWSEGRFIPDASTLAVQFCRVRHEDPLRLGALFSGASYILSTHCRLW